MDRARLALLRAGALLADALGLAALWGGAAWVRASLPLWWPGLAATRPPVDFQTQLWLGALVVPIWLVALAARGSYRGLRRKTTLGIAEETVLAALLGGVLTGATVFALDLDPLSRGVLAIFALGSAPLVVARRALDLAWLRRLRAGAFDPYRVLLVGDEAEAQPLREAAGRHPEWGLALAGPVPLEALAERLRVDPVDEVYVTAGALAPGALRVVAELCERRSVRWSIDADFVGLGAGRPALQDYEGYAVLTFTGAPVQRPGLLAKRALDVAGALLGLLLAAPLLLAIALFIRLVDGGPALFWQARAGQFGRVFWMAKLRSMTIDAEARQAALLAANEVAGPAFKIADDPRVTWWGRWLRRSSIDELPQLWNVLRGEMSLVGPRPPLPEEVSNYARWQLRRLAMKPGLTGIWQVSGRSEIADFDRWMALDLEYIDRWSLGLDLWLLLRTVPAVLSGRGAR